MHDFHLYIIPLLEILITNVTPIINNTATEHSIARSNLKIPPISSNKLTIFSSASGWIIADVMLYIIDKVASFIIGIIHIPIIIITPITPIAFFKTSPHPSTVSTESPNIFPTTGIRLDTAAFVVLAVIPSTLLVKVPSNEITPTNTVSIIPKNHTILDFMNLEIFSICILSDIFETIIKYIPEPNRDENSPLILQPALLDYNDYVGRIGIGRIKQGKIHVGENVVCVRLDGTKKEFRIQKLYGFVGLKKIEIESAGAGEIVGVAGLPDISVWETICEKGNEVQEPILTIEEPTLKMTFGVNTSPFAGREGSLLTARKIEERLLKELQKDVSLRVEPNDSESWIVSGRGELHLSILIENMRREGFELQVSKPEVIIKEIDGKKYEPWEDLELELPTDSVGAVIESLAARGGNMENMTNTENGTKLKYIIPSRGLIGFVNECLILTKGYGIINHAFKEYMPYESIEIGSRKLGVLVSMENGKATAYGLGALEDRGVMFIEPGEEVYEGMIVGENNRENDLAVNVTKAKQLTNTRSASKDHTVVLKRPRLLTLEKCLDYINTDELVEVTPKNFRMRQKILTPELRKKEDAKKPK